VEKLDVIAQNQNQFRNQFYANIEISADLCNVDSFINRILGCIFTWSGSLSYLNTPIFIKKKIKHMVCLNSKFPPTCYVENTTGNTVKNALGNLSISAFRTQNFRIKEKNENLF
jgi:hypothetical protein